MFGDGSDHPRILLFGSSFGSFTRSKDFSEAESDFDQVWLISFEGYGTFDFASLDQRWRWSHGLAQSTPVIPAWMSEEMVVLFWSCEVSPFAYSTILKLGCISTIWIENWSDSWKHKKIEA